jgi:hypothetical protein
MSYVKILLFFSLSFVPFFPVQSTFIKLKSETIPMEIKLIFESTEINEDNKQTLLNSLAEISEIIAKSSDQSQMKFLLKIETSKFILRWFNEKLNPMIFDLTPEIFESRVKKFQFSPFARWLVAGFISDLQQIKRDPGYASFANAYRKKLKNSSPEYKRLEKKIALLSPWIQFLHQSSADEVEFEIFKLQSSLFERLLSRIKLHYLITNNYPEFIPPKVNSELYEFYEKTPEASEESLASKINNLSAPEQTPGSNTPNQWKPDDVVKKVLPNYPLYNPNYKAPEKLPVPVNDWLLEL